MVKVSVCMATYNGGKFIDEQMQSILSQLSATDEVVVSDDGSTDNTLDVIRNINDNRIKVCINNGKHGYTPNFMNALSRAEGKYIFLSDQDDVWYPGKLEKCMAYLNDFDGVIHNAIITDGELKPTSESVYEFRKPYTSFIGNLFRCGYLGCCLAFKREVVDRALPFPSNHKFCLHDNWLILMGLFYYNMKITDEIMMYYRRHGGNTSNLKKSSLNLVEKLLYRIYLMYHIFLRWNYKGNSD